MEENCRNSILSNVSLGFIPLVIAIALSVLIPSRYALLTGAVTGLLLSTCYYLLCRQKGSHYILYSCTIVAIVVTALIFTNSLHFKIIEMMMPLTLEVTLLFPFAFVYFKRRRLPPSVLTGKPQHLNDQIRTKALTTSSIRVYFRLAFMHFALITVGMIFQHLYYNAAMWFLIQVVPIFVFALCILIDQFNQCILREEKTPEIIPIVTPQGEVVGRVDKSLTAKVPPIVHSHPVIRIAIICQGMLYLSKRSSECMTEKGKMDIPLETFLLYNEDINHGVTRIIKQTFPQSADQLTPEFSIKYRFTGEKTNQLIFLFILDLGNNENICQNGLLEEGKLWTFQQIEDNLGKDYFSDMFENEYEHLKLIIETREIYKEF